MTVEEQIEGYIGAQPKQKRVELDALHRLILGVSPERRSWFLDGRNEDGKIVSNPNIGYGLTTINYAGGRSRDFYRVGLSANTTGLSVYIMGLEDKTYLARSYGAKIGKASVSGYCVKFKTITDINLNVLEDVIRFALDDSSEAGD